MIFKNQRNSRTQDLINYTIRLSLEEKEQEYLMSRWLPQLAWMDNAAIVHKTMYYIMRFVMVVGGVVIPILVGSNKPEYLTLTFLISLVVGICTAVNEMFNYKEYWYHHRLNAELLRSEGWNFFLLNSSYKEFKTHKDAFHSFSEKVESIFKSGL